MSVPTHRPGCQSWTYPTNCRFCGAKIYVFQCTCDSVVLFDRLGWPWDKHDCSNHQGVGGSGLSGWAAVDVLRASGFSITPDILSKIFPDRGDKKSKPASKDTEAVAPSGKKQIHILAVVREVHRGTKTTEALSQLSGLGAKMLGLPKGRLSQVTLIINSRQPNLSYTCVLPEKMEPSRDLLNKVVSATLNPKVIGDQSIWLVSDMHLI